MCHNLHSWCYSGSVATRNPAWRNGKEKHETASWGLQFVMNVPWISDLSQVLHSAMEGHSSSLMSTCLPSDKKEGIQLQKSD